MIAPGKPQAGKDAGLGTTGKIRFAQGGIYLLIFRYFVMAPPDMWLAFVVFCGEVRP